MRPKRVTMADVAAKLGVSHMTVSLALRNDRRISEKRRQEVRQAVEQMGFVPDPLLSGFAAFRRSRLSPELHGALAWLSHWTQPERLRCKLGEFAAYWRGAEATAKQFGYRLDDICWEPSCSARRLQQIFLSRGIQGVLIPPHTVPIDWEDFDWNHFAVVRFGMSVQQPDSNLVTADHFRAVVMAIERIHQQGYQRIGLVLNDDFNKRLGGSYASGFLFIQSWLGLKPKIPILLLGESSSAQMEMAKAKEALGKWLAKHKPDAILSTECEIARLARSLGYRIPQDVAVAGTSALDIRGVDAGIDQHSEAIGRLAVETLIKQLNINERGEPADPVRIILESRWRAGVSLPVKLRSSETRATLASRDIKTSGSLEMAPRPMIAGQRVKLGDIAKRLGISKSAVSLALRNLPRVSLERRAEVQRVATEMGYESDPFLAGLSAYRQRGKTRDSRCVIAWINRWSPPEQLRQHREFDAYWNGASEAAERLGYQLKEFCWGMNVPGESIEQELVQRGVLGLLIPPHRTEMGWSGLNWSRFSIVRFGLSVPSPDVTLVASDAQRAILMAARRIQEYGYRRIGLVASAKFEHKLGGNFLGGFLWAQQQFVFKPKLPPLTLDSQSAGISEFKAALKSWMRQHEPDAILTTHRDLPTWLKELGYRIPEDVAVAGTSTHDIDLNTGLDQHPHAIGRIAVETLIKQITLNERGEPSHPCRILVESRWKDGKSLPRRVS